MRYALIVVVNGSFRVEAEYGENKQGAFVGFHDKCKVYWNAEDVEDATVAVVDENLDIVDGKKEYVSHHAPEPTPEPIPEPVEE